MADHGLIAVLQSLDAVVASSDAPATGRLLQGLAQHLNEQGGNSSYSGQLQHVGSSCCRAMLAMLASAEVLHLT